MFPQVPSCCTHNSGVLHREGHRSAGATESLCCLQSLSVCFCLGMESRSWSWAEHAASTESQAPHQELLTALCNEPSCSRDGFKEFFDQLHKNNVPLFIFSAGVGDILEEIIRQANVFYSNVNVVSNYMDFNDDVSSYIASV